MPRFRPPDSHRTNRFLKSESGATALEFSLVAAPFFFMMLCIIELGLVYMVSTSLDNATQEAARQIRTGELALAPGAPPTAATFRDTVCSNMGWLEDQCQANLSIDVRRFSSFAGQNPPDPVSGGNFDQSKTQFMTGCQGDIMLVRSFYRWKLITPVLYGALQKLSGGITVVSATAAFRNEPYNPSGGPVANAVGSGC